MIRKFFFGLLLLVSLTGVGCKNNQSDPAIRIGAVLPLTGSHAVQGQAIHRGMQLAVAEINSVGGINGLPVELHDYDDASSPNQSLAATKKLLKKDVSILIGGISPGSINAELLSMLEKKNAIMFVPSLLTQQVSEHIDTLVRVHSSVDAHTPIIERFLSSYSSPQRAAIIVTDSSEGAAYGALFSQILGSRNHLIVSETILPVTFDEAAAALVVSSTLATQNVQVLLSALTADQYAMLLPALKKTSVDIDILAGPSLLSAYAKGQVFPEDMKRIAVFEFSAPEKLFQDKYVATYKEVAPLYADTAYDAVYLIREALKKANMADAKNIQEALRELEIYHGASGIFHFDEAGEVKNKESILRIFDGFRFREFVVGDIL